MGALFLFWLAILVGIGWAVHRGFEQQLFAASLLIPVGMCLYSLLRLLIS